MTIKVKIHGQATADDNFSDTAADAINEYLDPEVDFNIDGYVRTYDFRTDGGSWSEVKEDFESHLTVRGEHDDQDTIHVCIIDEPFDVFGAGFDWSNMNSGGDITAGMSGVNGACKVYAKYNCIGNGKKAYMNTVIHETCHAMAADHTEGAVYESRSNSPVSPMQTWYSEKSCGNNDTVSSNCFNNPNAFPSGYERDTTYCTNTKIENYVANNT